MKFIWTVAGDDPDFNNGDKHGIDGYFYPLGDAVTTPAQLKATADRGYVTGVYVGAGWYDNLTPGQYVAKVAAALIALRTKSGVLGLRLMVNLEEHAPDRIIAILEGLREKLGNKVAISWSPEGMQGGWMSSGFVARVVSARVRVVPQAFISDMTRRDESAVLRDLLKAGFTEASVSLFYDAAQLPPLRDWSGYAFTEGRLPRI